MGKGQEKGRSRILKVCLWLVSSKNIQNNSGKQPNCRKRQDHVDSYRDFWFNSLISTMINTLPGISHSCLHTRFWAKPKSLQDYSVNLKFTIVNISKRIYKYKHAYENDYDLNAYRQVEKVIFTNVSKSILSQSYKATVFYFHNTRTVKGHNCSPPSK